MPKLMEFPDAVVLTDENDIAVGAGGHKEGRLLGIKLNGADKIAAIGIEDINTGAFGIGDGQAVRGRYK